MSTFQGLELARKALFAQQGALYTTGHNIANVNTAGYSRQRVNFETTSPFPMPSRVMPQIAGQIGTGVEIGTVQRIRDQFLDAQFRAENSRFGYWNTTSQALSRMENVLNELNETGLSESMDSFWQSLQDLMDHPDNSGARSVVAERGLAFAETFNHISKSLQAIQSDLKDQIDVSVKDINSLLDQINGLNEQIQKIEPHGLLANDLYDERDRLIDQLSQHMNIKVHYTPSSDSSLKIADGLASIEVLDSSGQSLNPPVYLIDANTTPLSDAVNAINVLPDDENNPITGFTVDGVDLGLELLNSDGSLKALIESFGYMDGTDEKGVYPEMLAELDKMAAAFAAAFNEQHSNGVDLNGVGGRDDFFVAIGGGPITAGNITVNSDFIDNSDLIAAGEPGEGNRNGNNALALSEVFDNPLADLGNTSTRKFYTALIGELGVKGQKANTMKNSTDILRSQVEHSRLSVTAVSLDEEISNLIKFQHAYNAAARSMTAVDELLDRIINQMGLVGR